MSAQTTAASVPAIDGGPKTRTTPMPIRKLFGKEEKRAVINLMDRAAAEGSELMGYDGDQETAYCRAFCEQMGGGFADGVNSGTNAVYAAIAALELEPGSEVVVSPITDPGSVMPVAMVGCTPVATDTAPGSFNPSVDQVEAAMTDRTRALLLTHISGMPIDLDPILELARARGIAVIEDCAQAHGAKYKGQPCGSLGDIAAFSTMYGKHHASGGQGGMVYTRREDLNWKARRYADRGKPFGLEGQAGNVTCSLNCNMDELHAAIGTANLAKLPRFVAQRRKVAKHIGARCEGLQTVSMWTERAGDEASYWFVVFQLDLSKLSLDNARFAEALIAEGIPAFPGYPFYPMSMPWAAERFGSIDSIVGHWPNAAAFDAATIRVIIDETWTLAEADDLADALAKLEAAYRS